jgi:hypothetical protein
VGSDVKNEKELLGYNLKKERTLGSNVNNFGGSDIRTQEKLNINIDRVIPLAHHGNEKSYFLEQKTSNKLNTFLCMCAFIAFGYFHHLLLLG